MMDLFKDVSNLRRLFCSKMKLETTLQGFLPILTARHGLPFVSYVLFRDVCIANIFEENLNNL